MRITQPADARSSLFLLNSSIAACQCSLSSAETNGWQATAKTELLNTPQKEGKKTMAEEEQAELSAFHNPSLSLSLSLSHTHTHTHYHLKSFLSSKPFPAFMYMHYKNSRRAEETYLH
jgi:hypothetical protein